MEKLPQPIKTLAIILAASEWPLYPNFTPSPSFKKSAEGFLNYLKNPEGLNLPSQNICTIIDDKGEASTIVRKMRTFVRKRKDDLKSQSIEATDLIFFYVGHGGFGNKSSFFLSVYSTDEDDPTATSITANSLGEFIRDCAFNMRSYLILDCCFAASAATEFMGGEIEVANTKLQQSLPPQGDEAVEKGNLPKYGVALLCASSSKDPAKAPKNLEFTMFCSGLLEALNSESVGRHQIMSLDDLYRIVRKILADRYKDEAVLPQIHAPGQREGRIDLVPIFQNTSSARRNPSTAAKEESSPKTHTALRSSNNQASFEHTKGKPKGELSFNQLSIIFITTFSFIIVLGLWFLIKDPESETAVAAAAAAASEPTSTAASEPTLTAASEPTLTAASEPVSTAAAEPPASVPSPVLKPAPTAPSTTGLTLHYEGQSLSFLSNEQVYNPFIKIVAQDVVKVGGSAGCPNSKNLRYATNGVAPYGFDPNNSERPFSYLAGHVPEQLQGYAAIIATRAKIDRNCISITETAYIRITYDNSNNSNIQRHYILRASDRSIVSLENIQLSTAQDFAWAENELNIAKEKNGSESIMIDKIVRDVIQ